MVDDITKAELQAMIDVQCKSATQMEKVANSLNLIVENQKSIIESLSGCSVCKSVISGMAKETTYIKWILTSLAAVISLGFIIMEVIKHG